PGPLVVGGCACVSLTKAPPMPATSMERIVRSGSERRSAWISMKHPKVDHLRHGPALVLRRQKGRQNHGSTESSGQNDVRFLILSRHDSVFFGCCWLTMRWETSGLSPG